MNRREEMSDNWESLIHSINNVAEELHVLHQALEEIRELFAWAFLNEKFRTPPDEWKAAGANACDTAIPEPEAIKKAKTPLPDPRDAAAAYIRKQAQKKNKGLFEAQD